LKNSSFTEYPPAPTEKQRFFLPPSPKLGTDDSAVRLSNSMKEIIMNAKRKRITIMGFILGFLVVAAGTVLLLKSLGVHINIDVWKFWPLLVIVAGLSKIVTTKGKRHIWSGLVFTAIGTLFLLNNLGQIKFWFDDLWPILIILVGLEIIRHSLFGKSKKSGSCCGNSEEFKAFFTKGEKLPIDKDFFNISAFLGSAEHVYDQKDFKGGKVSGVLGGIVIDLRDAEMAEDTATIFVSGFMAGIEIYVPNTWKVTVDGSSFMAAFENKTKTTGDAEKELIIKGSAFMAGIEIKN